MTEASEYMTAREVAALLRLPERTVSRLLNSGQLPGIYAGTQEGWRVRREDVLSFRTNVQPTERSEQA